MGLKVYISDNFQMMALDIYIVIEDEGQRKRVLQNLPDGFRNWVEIDPQGLTAGGEVKPTFSMDHEAAQALRTALDNYYEGTDEVKRVREDLKYERDRSEGLMNLVQDTMSAFLERVRRGD